MELPPDIQTVLVNATTNAVANTETDTTLLAAPGSTFRYRVWKVIAVNVQNAAAQVTRLYLREGTTGTLRAVCEFQVGQTGLIDLPSGGIALTANNALTVASFNTLTTQTIPVIVLYTLEART